MSTWLRVLAGTIVVLGLAVAVLLPNGYACRERDAVEVRRQWSYSQERWFYGCYPSREVIERGLPSHPMDAVSDWRIPLRIGVVVAGFALAWAVVARVNGQGFLRPALDAERRTAYRTTDGLIRILIILYALLGATIAFLLMLHLDSFCVRAADGLACSYKSFLGWNMEPILAEVLVAIVGAVGGAGLGVLVARLERELRNVADESG